MDSFNWFIEVLFVELLVLFVFVWFVLSFSKSNSFNISNSLVVNSKEILFPNIIWLLGRLKNDPLEIKLYILSDKTLTSSLNSDEIFLGYHQRKYPFDKFIMIFIFF